MLFGNDVVYLDAKKKIETKALGGSIPDAFLFDFSDRNNPSFYLVEVELCCHDLFRHIFPQITKFLGFFNNQQGKEKLASKLYAMIMENEEIKQRFDTFLQGKELHQFLNHVIENNQNILIVIDSVKEEISEIVETYSEWDSMVKILTLKKHCNEKEEIFILEPDFEDVEYSALRLDKKEEKEMKGQGEHTEETLLYNKNSNVKEIYQTLKNMLMEQRPHVKWKCTRNYISITTDERVAAFMFNKDVVKLVVMREPEKTKTEILKHEIKDLSKANQKFWRSECCEVRISDQSEIEEIIDMLLFLTK